MNGNFGEAVLSQGAFSPYQRGLDIIRAIQEFANPGLTFFMKLVTNSVSEYVFFAMIMILFWVVNERKAFRFGLLVLLSTWLNAVLKALFKQPRPFHLENSLGMIRESGYGLPSGHAQLILVFLVPLAVWFVRSRVEYQGPAHRLTGEPQGESLNPQKMLRPGSTINFLANDNTPFGAGRVIKTPGASRLRNVFVALAAALLVLLVSFSRLYLGLHFLQDILAGWVLGGLSLAFFFFLAKKEFLCHFKARVAAAAALPLLMNAFLPREISLGAILFGFAVGYVLMRSRLSFSAANAGPGSAIIRLLTGFCGAFILYAGLRLLFPVRASSWYGLFRFIRYATVGFWVSFIAPWLFGKLLPAAKHEKAEG
jgi:membrane-associated phospholipid phosphatase